MPSTTLDTVFNAVTAIDAKGAQQCAALRRHIPWEELEQRLSTHPNKFTDLLRIKIAAYRK